MFTQLRDLFEGGFDFETATAMCRIQTNDGIKLASVAWNAWERAADDAEWAADND